MTQGFHAAMILTTENWMGRGPNVKSSIIPVDDDMTGKGALNSHEPHSALPLPD